MRFKGANILKLEQQKRMGKEELLKLIIFGENENNNYQLEFGTFQLGSKSKKTKQIIENMKQTAAFYGAGSVSANQFCLTNSVFLMARNIMRKQEQWIYEDLTPKDYDVFINPVIQQISELQEYGWEYCISFPNLRAKVLRHSEIKVSYFDENFKEKEEFLQDFEARVFQHEFDHLQGYTMINMEVSKGNLERLEDEDDTPEFNKIFKEFQKFTETRKQQENIELKKQSRYFKQIRDNEGDSYWDPTEQVKSKYDEVEFKFLERMAKAIEQDRDNNNNKIKNPNLF